LDFFIFFFNFFFNFPFLCKDVEKRPSAQEVVDQLETHLSSSSSVSTPNIDDLYGDLKPDLLLEDFDGEKIEYDDNGDIFSLENPK
jgi:hypothetical protein